jgi:uncharacterized protein YdeI (YjbR/CyaY-like superfamily)
MGGRVDDAPAISPGGREEWRRWLAEHHDGGSGVWVTYSSAGRDGLGYEDLVREALCFGWVDSTTRRGEPGRRVIYMAPRRRGSTWAATNKQRVAELLAAGLMEPAGIAAVERAKQDGSWTVLDPVEALEVPGDLAAALAADPVAAVAYDRLSRSAKKQVLWNVISAKRPQTRSRRVAEVVQRVREGTLP